MVLRILHYTNNVCSDSMTGGLDDLVNMSTWDKDGILQIKAFWITIA